MSLNSNAIIDHEYYLQSLGVDADKPSINQDRIEQFINQASKILDKECHRTFVGTGSREETIDGLGTKEIWVDRPPINGITKIEWYDGINWNTVTYSKSYDSESGRIWFDQGDMFFRGVDNWRITYTWGWTIDSVPEDVKAACVVLVKWIQKELDRVGEVSQSFTDITVNYNLQQFPKTVQDAITNYNIRKYV